LFGADLTRKSFIFNISALRSFSVKDSSKALIYRKGETGPSFGKDLVLGKTISSSLGHSYDCDSNLVIDSLPAKITFL